MRVLMTNIIALCDEGLYEELLRYVPTERQEKIARCGKRQDRMRSLAAGLLLEYGLRSMGCSLLPLVPGTETVHLVCGTHGKPELSGGAGGHFNLSHAGDYAAAVFDEGEVGIDVEQVRRVNVNVMRRQFTAEENAYLLSEPDAFLRLWTRKESYCKAVGEGLHLPLSSFDVLEDQVAGRTAPAAEAAEAEMAVREADAGQFYLYTEVPVKGYVLSVCAGHPITGCPVENVDLRKLFDGIS